MDVSTNTAQTRKPVRRWAVRSDAGETIRERRRSLGLTQRDLGLLLGYGMDAGQTTVSRIEKGEGRLDVVLQASAALGLDTLDVLELR